MAKEIPQAITVVTTLDALNYVRTKQKKICKRLDKDNSLLEQTGEFATSDETWFNLLNESNILSFIEMRILTLPTIKENEAQRALETIWYAKQECSNDCNNMCNQCQKMEAKRTLTNVIEEHIMMKERLKNVRETMSEFTKFIETVCNKGIDVTALLKTTKAKTYNEMTKLCYSGKYTDEEYLLAKKVVETYVKK